MFYSEAWLKLFILTLAGKCCRDFLRGGHWWTGFEWLLLTKQSDTLLESTNGSGFTTISVNLFTYIGKIFKKYLPMAEIFWIGVGKFFYERWKKFWKLFIFFIKSEGKINVFNKNSENFSLRGAKAMEVSYYYYQEDVDSCLFSKNCFFQKIVFSKKCFFKKLFLWKIVFREIVFVNCDKHRFFFETKNCFFVKNCFLKNYFAVHIFLVTVIISIIYYYTHFSFFNAARRVKKNPCLKRKNKHWQPCCLDPFLNFQ